MSLDTIMRKEARLIILRELDRQPDGRLNSAMLVSVLETFGITRSRDWLHEELRWLAEIGAVRVVEMGSVRVAELLAKGRDHVERRVVIEGIKRPSAPEA
jgi:hypothetical protein